MLLGQKNGLPAMKTSAVSFLSGPAKFDAKET